MGEFRCQSQFWDGNPLWVFYNQVQRAQPLCATMGAQCARGCRCDCERVLTKRGHGRQDPSTGTSAVHQSFFGRLEGRKTLSKPPLVHLYPSSVHLEIISSGIFLTGLTVSVYGASWLDQLDSSPLRGQCTRFISFVFGTAFLAAGHLEIRCTEGGKFSWSAGDGGLTQCNHVIG